VTRRSSLQDLPCRSRRACPSRAPRWLFAHGLNLQLSECLSEHEAALSLAGGDPDVLRNYGWTRSNIFGNADGLRYVTRPLALDPLNWASHYAHVDVLYEARRYAEAVGYTLKLSSSLQSCSGFRVCWGIRY